MNDFKGDAVVGKYCIVCKLYSIYFVHVILQQNKRCKGNKHLKLNLQLLYEFRCVISQCFCMK